jgi:small subunit ribosomal protein S16
VAVKIKLKRMGKIHAPFYRIIVADARTKRDGRAIEEIGKYHPKNEPSLIEVDSDRAQHWLSVGAQPTDPVRKILEITGDWQKFKGLPGTEGTLKTATPKADKKDAYAAAVAEALGTGDAGKGRGRKPGGKAADDQADARAAAGKSGGRSGGKQASAGRAAKADTAQAEVAEAAQADAPQADAATAGEPDAAQTDAAKADTAQAEAPEAAQADAATAGEPEAAQADAATADKAAPAKSGKAAKAESADPAGDTEPAASATEQGNGA